MTRAGGTLFVVATPIGNLGDITLRAIDTLRGAARVVAEDTRRTRALLSHLGISGKPIDRLDAHASEADIDRALARLVDHGEDLALVSDAGTPVVSDPGTALIRKAAAAGVRVVPIPGASAVMAAVSASGLVTGGFVFLGFLPRAGEERREAVARVRASEEAVVLFEAPFRMTALLEDLAEAMPAREAAVGRELTKVHEEFLRGTLKELAEEAKSREWLGELTVVLGPMEGGAPEPEAVDLDARIDEELAKGRRPKEVAEAMAMATGRPRREIYARVLARRG
ncbi:MAG TPA: 16S rRNA (cytidine(1402)-2'-O)-methyltransferase [Polyangiaceae bacterium]|nr:16S rRNA (cytidine(1402)-2'-O)-methyltransferase [Polyangiaceae bacterium]